MSHNIVTIHLTLGNSQGEVCDEAETIYYTFVPEKAQEMGFSGCKVEGEYKALFKKRSFRMSVFAQNYSF